MGKNRGMRDDDVPSTESDAGPAGFPTLVRAGCIALVALGGVSAMLAGPSLLTPDSVRCSFARQVVDEATTDDKGWNDIDIGGRDPDDLDCAEAVTLAEQIPEKEDSEESLSVPDESAIRLRGFFAVLVGIGQVATGFLTLRHRRRPLRTAALVFASLGIVFPVLGIISVVLLVFVAYAIGFSAASQQVWPRQTRPKRGEG